MWISSRSSFVRSLGLAVLAAPVPSVPHSSFDSNEESLAGTIARLDELAGEFETQRDVKCWTSFKQLEKFVAGCQIEATTTHLKTAAIQTYVDLVWRTAASTAAGDPITGAEFDAAGKAHFAQGGIAFLEYTVDLGGETITIPYQDVDNFHGTVEPIRVLQNLAREIQATDATRPGLDEEGIESARQLVAVLTTALLRDAGTIARRNQHATIRDEDMLEADLRITKALGLPPLDAARVLEGATDAPLGNTRESMLAIAQTKVDALATFNRKYIKEKFDGAFDEDLDALEAEWATLPVTREASELHKASLVDLASFLLDECAKDNPETAALTGPQMLATIERYYPSIITFEGFTNVFPEADHICNFWVAEFQADGFRDCGWHWRAFRDALARASDDEVRPLDFYAMEELTEFLSVYGVGSLWVAGQFARRMNVDEVGLQQFKLTVKAFEKARTKHAEGHAERIARTQVDTTRREAELAALRKRLDGVFIAEYFSDWSEESGIDFAHETSSLVSDYRFGDGAKAQGYLKSAQLKMAELGKEVPVPNIEVGIAGGGVAVEDFDGDGLLDVYLVSGLADRLYRNLGDLAFEDVTAASGLKDGGEGRAAYFVDYDNDGDQDLFVTHVKAPNRLWNNQGDGTFVDVTEASGLPMRTDRISHSATWFDFDNDGHLDVYVGNFGNWLDGIYPLLEADSRNGEMNRLYRANGRGGFEDVTEKTGVGRTGWAHAVSHFDANGDGWQDIYIANDFGSDEILVNLEGESFLERTPTKLENQYLHGMSVGFTDLNGDRREDVYVSNIAVFSFVSKYVKSGKDTPLMLSARTTTNARIAENNFFLLSHDASDVAFVEAHEAYFETSATGCGWAWDADFFDFDNDGYEDLYVVNGREPNVSYDHERNVLFSRSGNRFYDVSAGSGADYPSNARGAVHADLDDDGDLDLVVNNYQSPAKVLRNNAQRGHWIRFRPLGTVSNADSIGATVRVVAGGRTQHRTVRGGSGFLSKEPREVHFGLGDLTTVDEVEIVWPSGARRVLEGVDADREYVVEEPAD